MKIPYRNSEVYREAALNVLETLMIGMSAKNRRRFLKAAIKQIEDYINEQTQHRQSKGRFPQGMAHKKAHEGDATIEN